MKYTWAITAIRLGLSIVLLYFAYRETGPATTIILCCLGLAKEVRGIKEQAAARAIRNWKISGK